MTLQQDRASGLRPPGVPDRWWRRPSAWLVVVAIVHAASPLVLMGLHWWFGIDETVYLSQINSHVPAGVFSAPRARGATLIAAPITLVTSNVAAVRIWVAALSGAGMYFAFRPWLRFRPGMVVPLAALLFSSIWTVIYYGFEVMPNEWVSFGALAATGYFLCYLARGRRGHLVAVVVSMTLIALLRPSDALYCGLGLIIGSFIARAPLRARLIAGAAVVAGAVLGSAEWVIEAYTSFGGLLSRVHGAEAEQGGGGLHFAGAAQLRTLAGPALCRRTCHVSAGVIYQLWWYAAAVLIIVAVVQARRVHHLAVTVIPIVVAGAMAFQYILTIKYSAPRFLIPTYALLSLPCAAALVALIRNARSRPPRVVVRLALVVGLIVNAVIQVHVITAKIRPSTQAYIDRVEATADQLRAAGIRKPCSVFGGSSYNAPTAYATGCSNAYPGAAGINDAVADGGSVAWISDRQPSVKDDVNWRRIVIRYSTKAKVYAYISVGTIGTAPTTTVR